VWVELAAVLAISCCMAIQQGGLSARPKDTVSMLRTRTGSNCKCRGVHRHCPIDMNQFRDEIIMPNIGLRFATYGIPLINIARTALLAAATVFLYWKARQLAVKIPLNMVELNLMSNPSLRA